MQFIGSQTASHLGLAIEEQQFLALQSLRNLRQYGVLQRQVPIHLHASRHGCRSRHCRPWAPATGHGWLPNGSPLPLRHSFWVVANDACGAWISRLDKLSTSCCTRSMIPAPRCVPTPTRPGGRGARPTRSRTAAAVQVVGELDLQLVDAALQHGEFVVQNRTARQPQLLTHGVRCQPAQVLRNVPDVRGDRAAKYPPSPTQPPAATATAVSVRGEGLTA